MIGGHGLEEGDGRENDPMTKQWRKCSKWKSVVMDAMRMFEEEEKVSEMVRPGKEEESKEEEEKEKVEEEEEEEKEVEELKEEEKKKKKNTRRWRPSLSRV